MKLGWILWLIFWSGVPVEAAELIVSAASSLTDSLNVLKEVYQSKHHGDTVIFNFGASGALEKQIETGAPVDVFISASAKEMDVLQQKHLILDGSRKNLLSNEMVLIVPKSNKAAIHKFSDLVKARRLVMGDPSFVPAGQYAKEILQFQGLFGLLKDRLVYGGNVRQVLEYVARDEVDAGLVFSTDAAIMNDRVEVVAMAPRESHAPILYPAAVLKNSTQSQVGREFMDFISGPEGMKDFSRYGFRGVTQ
jgi:molybdate transport system substrate-binding protein